jgi:hypothetical protein
VGQRTERGGAARVGRAGAAALPGRQAGGIRLGAATEIVAQVAEQALAPLQYALTELFDARGRTLTRLIPGNRRGAGGVGRVETVYQGWMGWDKLWRRSSAPGGLGEVSETRRRVLFSS